METIRGSCSSRAPMKNILKIIIHAQESIMRLGFCKTYLFILKNCLINCRDTFISARYFSILNENKAKQIP